MINKYSSWSYFNEHTRLEVGSIVFITEVGLPVRLPPITGVIEKVSEKGFKVSTVNNLGEVYVDKYDGEGILSSGQLAGYLRIHSVFESNRQPSA
jgi:hypothetical protein